MDAKPALKNGGVKPVGAAKLTIEILRALAKQPGPIGVTPLAGMLDRYPGTVYAVLKTLQAEGIVEFSPETKTYKLSLGGILEISNLQAREDVPQRIQGALREMSERFGICIYLSQRIRPDAMIIVDAAMPDRPLGLYAKIGFRIAVPLGGIGRLLVGYEGTDDKHLKAAYARAKFVREKPTFKQWAEQVRQDRMAGFAYEEDSVPEGLATIGVPIIEPDGSVKFVLNAIGPRGDLSGENLPVLVDAIKQLAAAASS